MRTTVKRIKWDEVIIEYQINNWVPYRDRTEKVILNIKLRHG